LRPYQEDRVLIVPEYSTPDLSLCAIFDGTSGDYSAEYASKNFASYLYDTKEMKSLLQFIKNSKDPRYSRLPDSELFPAVFKLMESSMRRCYHSMDAVLCSKLQELNQLYATSTAVTILLWKNLLTVGHLGDSKACIFRENHSAIAGGSRDSADFLIPEFLTIEHKPDVGAEYDRIIKAGGVLSWSNNKPYVRSPLFHEKRRRGERPMKLNYSRGLGAPDLKPYGFISDPTIEHFEIQANDKYLVLASDGLWDVLSPKKVGQLIVTAKEKGLNITDTIAQASIREMPLKNIQDNISVILITL
jgi:serine/threonine protein phosphatase PrpC